MLNLQPTIVGRAKLLASVIFACISISLFSAGEIKFPASEIPAELLVNANAVIRQWDRTYSVINKGHAKMTEHFVITILNKSADKRAAFSESYSKLLKMGSYSMYIFDAAGHTIKKVKQSEFKDYSAVPDISLYSDDRVIYYMPMVNTYPYTIEYVVEFEDYDLMGYPSWFPQSSFDISVENASMKLIVPKDFNFNVKSRNLTDSLQIIDLGSSTQYLWKTENLKAMDYEPYSVGIKEVAPNVLLAPSNFQLENYKGNLDSWESFGRFVFKLNQSTNTLSAKTIHEIDSILQPDTMCETKKVRLLYEYLQSKTRYINVTLGIGGWKPFDASVVDNLGYGDCKALTNYMKTLMDTAGIISYYTLIDAGPDEFDIDTSFPNQRFNHAFLCVPLKNDTIWLECTSQKNPFGYVGSFTANRHALVITPEGGKLIKTPALRAEDNMQIRKAEVNLDETGNGTVAITTKFSGFQYDDRRKYFYADRDLQKKVLTEDIDIANFHLDNWNYNMDKGNIPSITESIQLQLANYTTTSGKRIFVPLNLMNRTDALPAAVKDRKTSFLFYWAYVDIDTIVYNIPQNLKPEYTPETKVINSEFGNYTAVVRVEGNKIIYIRSLKMNDGKYPASKYKDYIEFKKKILSADNLKIALIKSDS
jgi:hypothetical protein